MGKTLGAVLVQPDDPAYLESEIDAAEELFAIGSTPVAQIREEYTKKQLQYSSSPFDPEGRLLKFFPGDVTIWSGYPGAGKTTLLRQLVCHLLHQQQGVFVASLEENPLDVFWRHACVALGTDNPSDDGLQWCVDMWCDRFRIWNNRWMDSDAEHARILAAIRVLGREGVRHAVIDSFMCLDVSSTDYDAQRRFAKAICTSAALGDVHTHLVAHPRKPFAPGQMPDINDVAGAADLGRRVANVVFVRRSPDENAAISGQCTPMLVSVCKQRNGSGALGQVAGWFHRGLRQFVRDQWQSMPTHYLPREAYSGASHATASV